MTIVEKSPKIEVEKPKNASPVSTKSTPQPTQNPTGANLYQKMTEKSLQRNERIKKMKEERIKRQLEAAEEKKKQVLEKEKQLEEEKKRLAKEKMEQLKIDREKIKGVRIN